ncbi:MAG TPA: cell division protein FtsQ/DivIB [Chloroflexota bacterium]
MKAPPRKAATRGKDTRLSSPAALWWSVGALLLCVSSLGAIFFGMFRIHQIDVVGSGLPSATIRQEAGVADQNVFTVQSDQVVARLSNIREIVVGRVETSFPDRVTVYAQERRPMVVWQTGRARYELDPEGNIIRPVTVSALPVITGPASQGGRIDSGIIQAVRFAVQALPSAPNGAVAMFDMQPNNGLKIFGRSGWSAMVGKGTAQSLANRIATLSSVLSTLQKQRRRLIWVDLRFSTPPMRAVPQ